MKTKLYRPTFHSNPAKSRLALLFVALIGFGNLPVLACHEPKPTPAQETKATPTAEAQATPTQEATGTRNAGQAEADTPKIPNEQLDSLVAPIALYPDPLLSQVLVASTYPLEIVQLQQWLETRGSVMNEKAIVKAVQEQAWDPSIQAMALLPEVVKRLGNDIKWTSDLGNAFLAQQKDVMDAVQRMRTQAQSKGTLKSDDKMKVETQVVESKTVVVIQQADPEVVYVPSYSPTVVWGAMAYPYPPIYYPPAGYYAGAAIGFGVGIAMGAAWGGGWGWGAGWGGGDVDINMNNNFNRNTNISGGNRNNINGGNRNNIGSGNRPGGGNNKWQHNPQHRGGAPYANKGIANKYGGAARGDSLSSRQATARQNAGQIGSGRGGAGTMDRSGGGRGQAGTMDRSGGGRAQAGQMDRSGTRTSGLGGGGGGDRIGSRETSRGSGASNRSSGGFGGGNSSFGGGGGSWGGGSARSSSSRGSSSMSRGGGGGMSRGGGGGGMSRGGGGGRGGGGRR